MSKQSHAVSYRPPHLGEFADQRVMRREMTHRIGRAGVAGQREGLAAAAAEIFFALRA